MILKLALSNLTTRKVRTALTAAAIALAVSLVVSVTSGYTTMEAAAHRMLSTFLASVDARITRSNESLGGVPESLIVELEKDPAVVSAVGRIETQGNMYDQAGTAIASRSAMLVGVTRPGDKRVELMEIKDGNWFDSSEGNVCVIDNMTALLVKDSTNFWGDETKGSVKVGETISIASSDGKIDLKVVGTVHKPKILAALQPSIYLPIRTLQKSLGDNATGKVSSILIDLDAEADPAAFGVRWREKLAAIDPVLKLRLTSEERGELDKNLRGLQIASFFGGAVSMLAAGFIIFSVLSMGVNERQRTLAMLRAVGAHKSQLAKLVIVEAILLSLLGVAIGVPLGLLWLAILKLMFADFLVAGIVLSPLGIAFALTASVLAALLASLLPAWGATRTDPLEAMTPLSKPSPLGRALRWAIPGAILASIDSMFIFLPWRSIFESMNIDNADRLAREVAFYGHFGIGLPTLMLGFFLMAPLIVVVVERVLGPILAKLFGLQFALLRQQLSGGVWRSAGTAAALMVGLAILVVMQIQGNTVIGGWRIPDKFPDLFLTSYKIGGLNPAEIEKIRNVQGIKRDEVLPIAIASPEFGSTIFSIRGAAVMPEATMFFGVEPKLALDMMELDFRDGTKEQAIELMKKNRRHILVTEEFRQLKGLKTGDKLPLKTTKHGVVDYTIAGVVWSPGIDVIVSLFDLGKQFEQRTAASIFGTLEDARDDFGVEGVYLFAANLEYGVQRAAITEEIKKTVGAWGLQAGDVRVVKSQIQYQFKKILLLVSTVAFSAMAVASLGVANTIMASVRSRRWQFGILRSIGVTRTQLLRIVLVESLLLGFVGVVLGLAAGGLLAINAKQELHVLLGYNPAFTIPWGIISAGAGIVMLISLLAGLWPAVSVARSQPLSLLSAGRSSG